MSRLRAVDRLEIIVLVDNVIDAFSDKNRKDVQPAWDWIERSEDVAYVDDHIFAGHGLALLVRTFINDGSHVVLYDTGLSPTLIERNMRYLRLDFNQIEDIVMSHGHWDHFGGLLGVLSQIHQSGTPVYVHPRMFNKRAMITRTEEGEKIREFDPIPSEKEIIDAGGQVISSSEPLLVADNTILRTGEVPRRIDYELGMPGHHIWMDGAWQEDEMILDDVSLIANVKGRGLVVMSGCSHAGIVNIMHEATRLTEEQQVYGIVGGLHLVGKEGMEKTRKTAEALKEYDLRLLVPCHCTGSRAQHILAATFPKSFVTGSVGHRYIIEDTDVS